MAARRERDLLAAGGLAGSFLPQELLAAVGIAPTGLLPVLVQLLGAALFAFALANWTARGSLFGGIYNRPLAMANLAHFTIGAPALVKAALRTTSGGVLWPLALAYAVFAAGFALVFFRSPASGPS